MAAALRALRHLSSASPARLLPSSLPGPFPKLYDAAAAPAAASSLPWTRVLHSSPPLVPSVLRRYCSASTARGGGTAIGLAPVHQAYSSVHEVPSPMLMRHQGCTKGAASSGVPALRRPALLMPRRAYYSPKFNSLQQWGDEEAGARFVLEKLQDIDKTLAELKRILVFMALTVGLFLHLLFRKVAALGEKVDRLERRRY